MKFRNIEKRIMRRFSAIIFLLCTFALAMSAQHIQRNYHDRSMSDVLIDLDKASRRYKISFIYNELEDFTVTQNVKTANIPDAIRKVIGFYPMQMTVGDSLITVECIRKSERKLIGRLIDNHNLPVEFANIQLLNPKDSSFLCGGVSNANGDFVIPCQQKQALMKVSFVGKMICLSTFSTTLAASTVTPFNRYEFACILTFPMRAIGTSLQIVL